MKKLILGIIIGITLSISTITFAQATVKLIMVPEYINGYSTIDLLNYVSQIKAKEDKPKIIIPQVVPKVVPQTPKSVPPQGNYRGNASA